MQSGSASDGCRKPAVHALQNRNLLCICKADSCVCTELAANINHIPNIPAIISSHITSCPKLNMISTWAAKWHFQWSDIIICQLYAPHTSCIFTRSACIRCRAAISWTHSSLFSQKWSKLRALFISNIVEIWPKILLSFFLNKTTQQRISSRVN